MNNVVSQTAQCCFGGGPTSPTSAQQCNIIGPVSRDRGVVTISLGNHPNLFFCHWAVTQDAADKIVQIRDPHVFTASNSVFFCIYLPMDRLFRIPLTVIILSPKKVLRKLVKFTGNGDHCSCAHMQNKVFKRIAMVGILIFRNNISALHLS